MKTRRILLLLVLILSLLLTACGGGGDLPDLPDIPGIGGDGGNGGNGGGNSGGGNDCIGHKDDDANGKCDDCGISVVIIFDFFALNDLHGKLDDTSTSVGVDELSSYLMNAYKENSATVVLSSGDMWQGSAESNLTRGAIITEWMNEMDFVSMTLGNHEFDWGSEYIDANRELAEFPILAINIFDKSTGERADYCEASVIVERNGVKIGIIGAIGDCKSSISSSYVTDVDFKVGRELTNLVKAESERLRRAGCEFIVYSLHDGFGGSSSSTVHPSASDMAAYYDVALSDGYVDLVFEGHSHASYVHVDEKGVYHLQNGGYDNGISHVEVELNIVKDTASVKCAEIVENEEYAELADHPSVDALLEKYGDVISIAMREIGRNTSVRGGEFIKQLVADLYIARGLEKWGDKYDILLGGGYISVRDPGMLPAGKLLYYDVMSILPFDNEIFLCTIKGDNLYRQFINTSNANYFVGYSEYGESVKNNIDRNATYYIIADKYSVDYAPNGLTAIESLGANIFARDLLADYITRGGLGGYVITSIEDILELGASIPHNYETTESFCVKGTVIEVPNAKYGNTTIRDEEGNTLYIYGIKTNSGGLFEDLDEKPELGDTVTLSGVICHYKKDDATPAIVEMKNATIISIEKGNGELPDTPVVPEPDPKPDPEPDPEPEKPELPEEFSEVSIADAIKIGSAMADDEYTEGRYYIIGTITDIFNATFGNVNIADDEGNKLYIYGIYDNLGQKFGEMTSAPMIGDKIKVLSHIGAHDGKPQLKNATLIEVISGGTAPEEPEEPVDPEPIVPIEITLEEALKIGAELAEGESTEQLYYISGVVVSINNETYGNLYIQDENGNKLYVYGVYDGDGNRYDAMATKPTVGDNVKLLTNISNFKGTIQLKSATLLEITEGDIEIPVGPEEPEDRSEITIKEALELGEKLDHDCYTTGSFYIVGEVTKIASDVYGNMYIVDAEGNTLYVYGLYTADGVRFDAMETKPQVGDTVKLLSKVGCYSGNPQLKNAVLVEIVSSGTAPEEPETPVEPEEPVEPDPEPIVPIEITLEEALKIGAELAEGESTEQLYYISGVVVSINNETYGNLYIQDANGNKLYVYGVYDGDGNRYDAMETKPAVGDTVKLLSVVGSYMGTPQLKNAVLVEIVSSGTAPEEPETPVEPEEPVEPETPTLPEEYSEISIPEANKIGSELETNAYTDAQYYVVGTVVEITNTVYGNFYIEDAEGNRLYVYGLYTADNIRFDAMENPPKVGDTVKLLSVVGNYKGTPQLKNAVLVEIVSSGTAPEEPETPVEPETPTLPEGYSEISIPEANKIGSELETNAYTDAQYYVVGTVVEITNTVYGNFYIEDAEGNRLYVYGLYTADNIRFDAMENPPKVGDTVKLLSVVGNYMGTPQLKNAVLVEIVSSGTAPEEPETPVEPETPTLPEEYSEISIPEANKIGSELETNAYTDAQYYVVGTVVEIKNAVYGNFYIEDAEGNRLYVYGLYTADNIRFDAMENPPKVGDTVKLLSVVGNYKGTPQLKNAVLVTE